MSRLVASPNLILPPPPPPPPRQPQHGSIAKIWQTQGQNGIYICRIALAEQEARTDFLRKKAKHRQIGR